MDKISSKDFTRLRTLAETVAELAARPEQAAKADLWRQHNDLHTNRPLVFCDPENGWNEIITPEILQCEGSLARQWEFGLRRRIFSETVMKDDTVADNIFTVPYVYSDDGWGVEIQHIGQEKNKAYIVKQAIEDYEEDFHKVHFPRVTVDYAKSDALMEEAHRVFDGVLNVQRYQMWWWSLGLTCHYIDLRGLEDFMVDLVLEPEWVHRMMDLLCQGVLDKLDSLEAQGLLFQNIGNQYVGSGGFGFTDHIKPVSGKVTPMDMWGFVESQETVSVSPEMYAEFVFPYHKRIADRFAMNCCGCCEPYDLRWKYMKELPRLRRISCSPWSKRDTMAENLGKNYIASIKLNPAPLALANIDEATVRAELRDALENSVDCIPEVIMKDCHTIGKNPNNAVRWVEIAREEIDRVSGL